MIAPDRAFVLAAGRGTRLRPYTDTIPKPMVEVGGRTLIDRILDKLEAANVKQAVVNTHYQADILELHLEGRSSPRITISHENELLDTGGGVVKALPHLGSHPFYVIAGDALWTDGPGCALKRLAAAWDPARMDILTLLQPRVRMTLTGSAGDYDLAPDGRVIRSRDKTGAYMWTNIRLNAPSLYQDAPTGAFSFLDLMDRAERAGRFYALVHDGDWHHISTPQDLERVRENFGDSVVQKVHSL